MQSCLFDARTSGRRVGGSWCAAVAVLWLAAAPASGSMILSLDDTATGGTDVVIIDGQLAGAVSDDGIVSNTSDPDGLADGFISYNGAAGPTFTTNVTTGITKPNIGPARMDLNDISLTSTGGGTLVLSLTDTNFVFGGNGDPLAIVNEFGGVTDGTITATGAVDLTNAEFGAATASVSQGPFGPGAFSDTDSANFVGSGANFSLTEVVTITHDSAGDVTSFNKALSVVPEPSTALLLTLGLLGLGGAAGRPRQH